MSAKLRFFLVFILSFGSLISIAQKKKEIKKYGIKTVTSTKSQGGKILKDEKLTYNSNGLLTEEVKYDEAGELVSVTRYKYNAEGDVTEEAEYNGKIILVEKRSMKYNVLSQKKEELITDKAGKQIKKFVYTYDSKGLRSEKKTFDANNTLVITKKIVYGYK